MSLWGRIKARLTLVAPRLSKLRGPRKAKNFGELARFSGELANSDNLGVETYERMVETDETISSALEFISLSVYGYLGEYQHPSSRIQKFVRQNFEEMRGSLAQVVDEILTALWAGFSVTEIVFREKDGRIWIDELPTVRPHNLVFRVSDEGDNAGQIVEIIQNKNSWMGQEVKLSPERCIHYAHKSKFSNPYGLSRLRAVWKSWFMKDVLLKAWGMTLERYGSPVAVGKTSSTATVIDENGIEKSRDEYLLSVLENLQNSSVLVIGTDEEVILQQVGRAFGGDFEAAQNHLNRMIFRALLLPALVFEAGDIGSYAMAQKHFEVFVRSIGRLRADVTRVLVQQLITRLVWLNFGPQQTYGQFVGQTLEEEDLKLWSEIFYSLTSIGYLSPKLQSDLDLVRNKFQAASVKVEEMPEPAPIANGGKDGIPGQAPDGQDSNSSGPPMPTPRVATTNQGRPNEAAA